MTDEITEGLADADRLASDAELARLRAELASYRNRYKAALSQIDKERERADALVSLQGVKPVRQKTAPKKIQKKHDATMVVLLSDIHCEEVVRPETVNGLNAFDLDVCDLRIAELQERFFTMLAHERELTRVDRVVLWLGGDLISGMIHPELAEENSLHPLAAIRWIGERLRGFIDAVSDNAREVVIATHRRRERQRPRSRDRHKLRQPRPHHGEAANERGRYVIRTSPVPDDAGCRDETERPMADRRRASELP